MSKSHKKKDFIYQSPFINDFKEKHPIIVSPRRTRNEMKVLSATIFFNDFSSKPLVLNISSCSFLRTSSKATKRMVKSLKCSCKITGMRLSPMLYIMENANALTHSIASHKNSLRSFIVCAISSIIFPVLP